MDRPCLDVSDGDGFGQAASAVQDVGHLVRADLPLGVDELGETFAVEGNALLSEGEVVVHR